MSTNRTQQQFYNMFLANLQNIYCAENQYIQAFPKFLERISTEELKKKFKNHFEETKKQKDRLIKIFNQLNESPSEGICEGMKGLLNECEKIANENVQGLVKDAALICALQKVEHYQIATYGALKSFAKHLDLNNVQKLLQEILTEEWNADKNLTSMAEGGWFTSGINQKASR